jgi:hypothetical protein
MRRVKHLKATLASAINGARAIGQEAETSLKSGNLAIDKLVSLTASAQIEVFEQCLLSIQRMETDGRDPVYVFRVLEHYVAQQLSEMAVEMSDHGLRGSNRDEREKQVQRLGAFGRVMKMIHAA